MAKRKHIVLKVLFVLCACVFLVSAGLAGWTWYQQKQAADAFAALQAQQQAQMQAAARDAANAVEALAAGYDNLHSRNADYAAWLNVSGTKIDYPVMWTPSSPEYYLRRAFDQSQSASGTPFIAEGADIDSDCLIIYGHEMHNGTMFGELDKYADVDFYKSNGAQSITIYTRTEMRRYEIFAAVQTRILGDNEEGYRYYNAAGPLDQAKFSELVGWLKSNALYDTGVTPNAGEQILILSTCSYHTENGRFLVAARRVS